MWIEDRQSPSSRRDFLSFSAAGVGSLALAWLLGRTPLRAAQEVAKSAADFSPKARRVIQIVLNGGLSHLDSMDYKPELVKHHGSTFAADERPDVFNGKIGLLRRPDWEFHQHGESGLWLSDLFPHLAQHVDELTLVRSMVAETSNHTPATFQQHSGFRLNGFPVMGAWLSYGLGTEAEDLPAYVAMPDARGVPAGGAINWTSGFLPARHQGVTLRASEEPIEDLHPARPVSETTEVASRKLLARMNSRHLQQRGGEDPLLARLKSYELAARMQLAVPEVANLEAESEATHELYGLTRKETRDFGGSCLMARRLIERGVRFVQLFSGGAFGKPRINWDGHEDMVQNHGREALRIDQPVAGLLTDLRQRGLLADTLVLFTTEFGRTPFTESADGVLGTGRDHNQYGFSVWLAGAGLKPGIAYGATDEIGMKAVEKPVEWYDLHATLLHLLGIDHEQLTFYHDGIQRRLTNVHGHVLHDLLA
jgi:hypothetical protein